MGVATDVNQSAGDTPPIHETETSNLLAQPVPEYLSSLVSCIHVPVGDSPTQLYSVISKPQHCHSPPAQPYVSPTPSQEEGPIFQPAEPYRPLIIHS